MEKARCSLRESNPQPFGPHLLAASDSSGFVSQHPGTVTEWWEQFPTT